MCAISRSNLIGYLFAFVVSADYHPIPDPPSGVWVALDIVRITKDRGASVTIKVSWGNRCLTHVG